VVKSVVQERGTPRTTHFLGVHLSWSVGWIWSHLKVGRALLWDHITLVL